MKNTIKFRGVLTEKQWECIHKLKGKMIIHDITVIRNKGLVKVCFTHTADWKYIVRLMLGE